MSFFSTYASLTSSSAFSSVLNTIRIASARRFRIENFDKKRVLTVDVHKNSRMDSSFHVSTFATEGRLNSYAHHSPNPVEYHVSLFFSDSSIYLNFDGNSQVRDTIASQLSGFIPRDVGSVLDLYKGVVDSQSKKEADLQVLNSWARDADRLFISGGEFTPSQVVPEDIGFFYWILSRVSIEADSDSDLLVASCTFVLQEEIIDKKGLMSLRSRGSTYTDKSDVQLGRYLL